MKLVKLLTLAGLFLFITACEKSTDSKDDDKQPYLPDATGIADNTVATEQVLRSIPEEYINAARNNLHISYQHTSHGTHVSYGMYGLPGFQEGDEVLFAISRNNPTTGALDFRDNVMSGYAPSGETAPDLSAGTNETSFVRATQNYLDAPENASINVVMWSWCDIAGHDVANNYLPGMQTLIDEYGPGGSKIHNGIRTEPVTFIFMTGHANVGNNIGEGRPKNQADLILDFCSENGYYCIDYYNIDTHCMEDNYWEDAGDDGNSNAYGGNFYIDWQDAHTEGVDYYPNRTAPGGDIAFGQHNSQHITANRKAFALWYILARIAGWDGN